MSVVAKYFSALDDKHQEIASADAFKKLKVCTDPALKRDVFATDQIKKGELTLWPVTTSIDIVSKVNNSSLNGGCVKIGESIQFYAINPKTVTGFTVPFWFVSSTPIEAEANIVLQSGF